jgi:hypothetical protein
MRKFLLFLFSGLLLSQYSISQSEFEFTHFNQATVPIFGGNNFKAVAVARGGHIWAGSQYHGVVKYDPNNKTWDGPLELGDVFVSDIKTDHFGNIYISNAGRQGTQGGGTNIGGGISQFHGEVVGASNFWTITSPGFLVSRNVRSLWVDKTRRIGAQSVVWAAQGTYISSNQTVAGGISVGKNEASPYFTKVFEGLQVTPYVASQVPVHLAVLQ